MNSYILGANGRIGNTKVYVHTRCDPDRGLFFDSMWAKESKGKLIPLPDPLTGAVVKGFKDLFPSEPFCPEYFAKAELAEEAAANSIPDVTCGQGRYFGGFVNGEPVCGNTPEDLPGPPVFQISAPTSSTVTKSCLGVPGLAETCIVKVTDPSPGKTNFFGEFITLTPQCNIKKITADNAVSYVEQCL